MVDLLTFTIIFNGCTYISFILIFAACTYCTSDCAATQSVPDVSTTCKDNDLRNPEATSVSFGALENSAVDIGLVCQGELTIPVPYCGFQYSVSYYALFHEWVIIHCCLPLCTHRGSMTVVWKLTSMILSHQGTSSVAVL